MKRFGTLLLILVSVLILAACGPAGQGGDEPGKNHEETHIMFKWYISNEATCSEEGQLARECQDCDFVEYDTYVTTVHNYVNGTCAACGKKEPNYSKGLYFESNGDGTCSVLGRGSFSGVDLIIPPTSSEGDRVTAIGQYAFESTDIESVVIPDTVKSIGDRAFSYCNNLRSVTIPASVESIGSSPFYETPEGLELHIEDLAAYSSIDIGTIDDAYYNVYGKNPVFFVNGSPVTDLVIPNGAEKIGRGIFCGTAFESVTIPGSAVSVGVGAFYACDNLKKVVMNEGVKQIKHNAFSDCYSLQSVSLPDTMERIDRYVFVDDDNIQYNTYDNARYLGNSSNKYVYLVSGLSSNITSCEIPAGTKVIGAGAFYDAFPGSSWGSGSGLKSVVVPEGVVTIEDSAFMYCDLEKISLPDSLSYIGARAIENYGKLALNQYQGGFYLGNETNKYVAFYCGTEFGKGTLTMHKDTKVILSSGFNYASYSEIVLNEGLRYIASYGMCDAYDITKIVIPEGVTGIGYAAFEGCKNLEEIHIPVSLTTVDDQGFLPYQTLKIYYGGSEKRLMEYEDLYNYLNAYALELIYEKTDKDEKPEKDDGNCSHSFGQWTFSERNAETGETILVKTCEKCGKTETLAIKKVKHSMETIPAVEATCAHPGSTKGKRCTVCGEYTEKPETIPPVEHKFEGGKCTVCGASEGLWYEDYDGSGESLYVNYMGDCTSSKVVIPAYCQLKPVVMIGSYAFENYDGITEVVIQDGIEGINNYVFADCDSLVKVTIPASVKYIGEGIFENSYNLNTIVFEGSKTEWENMEKGYQDDHFYNITVVFGK